MELPKKIKDEIWDYCRANNITNIDEFVIKMVQQGFTIEKFGVQPITKTIEKIVDAPIAMIDSEISDSHNNYMKQYEESVENLNKLSNQLMITEKQLAEEKKKNKKDIYGEK